MLRFLIPTLAVLALSPLASLGAADERTPLVVHEFDLIQVGDKAIEGFIVSEDDAGGIRLRQRGATRDTPYGKTEFRKIHGRQSATAAVRNRGRQALAANDFPDAEQAARWGVKNGSPLESLALARAVLERQPGNTEMAELAIDVLRTSNDDAGITTLCAATLKSATRWERGYRELCRIYLASNNANELASVVERWINVAPTSGEANALKAEIAALKGDLRSARDALLKSWKYGNGGIAAAMRVAILSFRLGDRAEAVSAAGKVIEANQFIGSAKGIIGVSRAMDGAFADAAPLFEAALSDPATDAQVLTWVKHARAVIASRSDETAAARALAELNNPVSKFAQAMIERTPFAQVATLPPALQQQAVLLNVALAVQRSEFAAAQQQARTIVSPDARFVQIATDMLADPTESKVRGLESFSGVASQRMQAYGHILGKRFAKAQAILDTLPADDGYAAVYRVYVAAALKDTDKARALFEQVKTANNPPPPEAYAARLAASYDPSELLVEGFDWPNGYRSTGWQILTQGTGISVRAEGGALRFTGTQANDQATLAWRLVPTDRVKHVEYLPSAVVAGRMGLMIANESAQDGCAIAVQNNRIVTAVISKGRLGAWRQVVEGLRVRVGISPSGTVELIDLTNPNRRTGLDVTVTGGLTAIGIIAVADKGQPLDVSADEVRIALKPSRN